MFFKNKIRTIVITDTKTIQKIKNVVRENAKYKVAIIEYENNVLKINGKKIIETKTETIDQKYTGTIKYEKKKH